MPWRRSPKWIDLWGAVWLRRNKHEQQACFRQKKHGFQQPKYTQQKKVFVCVYMICLTKLYCIYVLCTKHNSRTYNMVHIHIYYKLYPITGNCRRLRLSDQGIKQVNQQRYQCHHGKEKATGPVFLGRWKRAMLWLSKGKQPHSKTGIPWDQVDELDHSWVWGQVMNRSDPIFNQGCGWGACNLGGKGFLWLQHSRPC